jgi:hypothetical protein
LTILLTASFRTYKPEHGVPVVASLTTPKWMPEAADWPRCTEITPRWSYFRAEHDEWDAAYLAQLTRYGPQRISRRLSAIAAEHQADRLCILCWEVLPKDCHRGFFASWLLVETGEKATEIIP